MMAGLPVMTGEFWSSDYEARRYEDWVMALPGTVGDGFRKRRSNSAPAERCGHHPHIHDILTQALNNLKSQPLEVSKRENVRAPLFDCLGESPHKQSRLSFKLPAEKDVDGCQPKMREPSGSERKRKKRQHSSSNITLPIETEDGLSIQSLEEIAALPSNIEDEGVATSCKRIKLNTPRIKKFNHSNIFESSSYTGHAVARSVDELGDLPDHSTLDSDSELVSTDGEAREQKTLSGSRNSIKKKPPRRDFLARYKGPANNIPDYGSPAAQNPVTSVPGGNRMMAGERKSSSIPGSFRPVNTLKHGDKSSAILPHVKQKKVFDLHQINSISASDESPAAKRQKIGPKNLVRRASSGSVIEISGDGNQVEAWRNLSSTSSTPKKTVQSVSSRSHHQNQQCGSRLGEVGEYKKTEAMIGFASEKKRQAVLSMFERNTSSRGEMDSSSGQRRSSAMSESPISEIKGRPLQSVNGVDKNPILVDDLEPEEEVEPSQPPEALLGRTRNATQRPAASKVPESAEKSQYFAKPDKPSKAKDGILHTIESSSTSRSTVGALERYEDSSPNSFHSLSNGVDDGGFLEEDSVDLVKLDGGTVSVDLKAEDKSRVNINAMNSAASPKSMSISQEGDILRTTFSELRAKKHQNQTSRTLKSDLSFEITEMHSGYQNLVAQEGSAPWKLQYDHERSEFNITALNGEAIQERHSGLTLKPAKIHVVKYNQGSLKVVIGRAMEPSIGAAAQVLLQLHKMGDGYRLAQSLIILNHTIKLTLLGREQLDNTFTTTLRATPIMNAEDIALLEVKEARRIAENEKMRETAKRLGTSNTDYRRELGGTAEQINFTQTRRQSIANRMQPNLAPDALVPPRIPEVLLPARNELSNLSRLSTLTKEDFYSSRPATRSSGQWNGERQFQPIKPRSPSPVRWTEQNSSWKEERSWKTSLTYPKEGKKKATVDAEDIQRLDEGEFLNDNLIAFYLRYLEDGLDKSQPELARRIYFHNTFFYETLTKGKVRSNNINYDAVKRWTSKVDLFTYDYVVVPVCEKLHWYVAIICNAPRLLKSDAPEIPTSQDTGEHAKLQPNVTSSQVFEKRNEDSEAPQLLDISDETGEPGSAPPSVTAQVEHMSLEDQDQEWPEPDAKPDMPPAKLTRLQSLPVTEEHNNNPMEDELQNHCQSESINPKGKKLKRKSVPYARKYDPTDPRIITLDSLGQAHSPTCSNLKEYLICEAKERHNVGISPGRLGMTAKGLPQQSNYCDCGVFVLGYIEKFLKNPDDFVRNILQGNVGEEKTRVAIGASQMRGEIRELIFNLQAEQIQDEKSRREAGPKVKKVSDTEALPRVSRKSLGSNPQLINSESSNVAQMEVELADSKSMEQVKEPMARSVAGKDRNGVVAMTLETRRYSSATTNGHDSGPVEEKDPPSIDVLRAKRSGHYLRRRITPVAGTEESEIMETPAPSVEDEPILVTNKSMSRNRDYMSSPNSTDTSIPFDSSHHPASSERNWFLSTNSKADARSRTRNTFKEFAKNNDSPFQNTRHRSQHEKTSENDLVEINDSQEGHQLEVRETPPRQREQDASSDGIQESPYRSRRVKAFTLDVDQSPELEVVSPSSSLKRRLSSRR